MNRIKEFLSKCRTRTYAAGDEGEKIDGGTKYSIKKENLEYRDVYYDQKWVFEGQEIVFNKDLPVWSMSYRGTAVEGVDTKEVFGQLQKILKEHSVDVRLPGNKEYNDGQWRYEDKCSGDFDEFEGEEKIYKDGKLVHWMKYFGGKII
ncbi:MAG: hypothetical protein HW405_90 [Candidatus Berkelbacteria bacterium]|nr:hypothetical protein [Candidatus Berkelbacteria bacterium]